MHPGGPDGLGKRPLISPPGLTSHFVDATGQAAGNGLWIFKTAPIFAFLDILATPFVYLMTLLYT